MDTKVCSQLRNRNPRYFPALVDTGFLETTFSDSMASTGVLMALQLHWISTRREEKHKCLSSTKFFPYAARDPFVKTSILRRVLRSIPSDPVFSLHDHQANCIFGILACAAEFGRGNFADHSSASRQCT